MIRMEKYDYGQKNKYAWTTSLFLYS
jgi:hypothetical protein